MSTDIVKVTTPPCMLCGDTTELAVEAEQLAQYEAGGLVQDVFPDWSPGTREVLVSGTHPDCWSKMFGDIDDE